jgi:hypothetical protein
VIFKAKPMNDFPVWLNWLFQCRIEGSEKAYDESIDFDLRLSLFCERPNKLYEDLELEVSYYPDEQVIRLNIWNKKEGECVVGCSNGQIPSEGLEIAIPSKYSDFNQALYQLAALAQKQWFSEDSEVPIRFDE